MLLERVHKGIFLVSLLLNVEYEEFLDSLEDKAQKKIVYNIDKAKLTLDPELFKKLDSDIWEFRTKFNKKKYRLLAFWDKRDSTETLVIATHGFIKKTQKTPTTEINRTRKIMEVYFKTI